jgi:hypothetical protein
MSAYHSKATAIHRLHAWEFANPYDKTANLATIDDTGVNIQFKEYVQENLNAGVLSTVSTYKATLTLNGTILTDNSEVTITDSDYEPYNGTFTLDKVNNTTYVLIGLTQTASQQIDSVNSVNNFTIKRKIVLTLADIGKRCYEQSTKTFYDLVGVNNGVGEWFGTNNLTQKLVEDWDTVLTAGVYYSEAGLTSSNSPTNANYVGFVQKLADGKVIQTLQTVDITNIREYKRFSYTNLLNPPTNISFSNWIALTQTIETTFEAVNVVVVTHNLGKYPLVNVLLKVGTAYELILANTVHNSNMQVTITFSTELTGKILIN